MMEFINTAYGTHRRSEFIYSISTAYSVLVIFGILFNLFIVLVIIKHCIFHNVTNIFVLTLAISDILLCGFNIPLQTYYEITETSGFGTVTCKIFFALFSVPLYISCLTILLIAVDRYRIIIYPLKERISKLKAVMFILFIVVFSIISSIPVALFTHSIYSENISSNFENDVSYCVEYWPNVLVRLCYSIAVFLCQYFLPLIITAYLYISIYCRLKMRTFKKRDNARKLRTNKILIAIVLCFSIFWSPWTIYSLYLEFHSYFTELRWLNYDYAISNYNSTNVKEFKELNTKMIDLILKSFATCSCVINPFLYGWLNDSIKEVICRFFKRIRDSIMSHLSRRRQQSGEGNIYRFTRLEMKNTAGSQKANDKPGTMSANRNQKDGQYLNTKGNPSLFEMSTKRTSLYPSNIPKNNSHLSEEASNVNYESSFICTMPQHVGPSDRRFTNDSSDITLTNCKEFDVFAAMAIVVKQQTFDRSRRVSLAIDNKKKHATLLSRKTSLM